MPDREDDIDHVFKQASENYRLKEAVDNWNVIAGRLSSPAPARKNGLDKKLGLILLLLLTAGGAYLVFNNQFRGSSANEQGNEISREEIKKDLSHSVRENESATNELSQQLNSETEESDQSFNHNSKTQLPEKIAESFSMKIVTPGSAKVKGTTSNHAGFSQGETNQQNLSTGGAHKMTVISPTPEGEISPTGNTIANENSNNKITEETKAINNFDITILPAKPVSKDSLIQHPDNKTAAEDNKQQVQRGFLVGLAGGPEWNIVSKQKVTRAGYDVGLIIGYKFNNRLSVESGIGIARKYYYSQGKYFKLDMPGKEVISLEGSASIIEIPLKLKYNFPLKNRSSLYGSAGVMSYLLTDETNDYILLVNGAEMNMTNNYPEASRYFAGAIDLGAGYEYFINPLTSFRIEPYVQIPLKGIGVGKMQVMSFGLHAGISRLLKRSRK